MAEQAGEGSDQEKQDARETLGHALVTLRRKAGKSLAQLAEDTGYERSYLNRLETGQRISKRPVIEDLDTYYGTDGLLVRLWKAARNSVIVNRYKLFMQYEEGAVIMHKYMQVMPGLLQTEDYARAVLSSSPNHWGPDWLEEQVALRLSRQELLNRDPSPSVRVILDESVLRRPTTDPKTWAGQLSHLVESAERPSIVVQVLPFSAGVHDLMGGSLSVLWQADGVGVAYLEGSKSGELIEDAEEVAQYRLSYDQLRDSALSPPASLDVIRKIMEGNAS
ncbi:helix-turn-helix domain-containing protein [Streptomyces sp. YGL11-2]|uniref:helix-turn-helix domain-containing protein n=1 Tax=Streptomyces sp. YGL11-2 TaxID=3414028 RepID=UPI003CF1C908